MVFSSTHSEAANKKYAESRSGLFFSSQDAHSVSAVMKSPCHPYDSEAFGKKVKGMNAVFNTS